MSTKSQNKRRNENENYDHFHRKNPAYFFICALAQPVRDIGNYICSNMNSWLTTRISRRLAIGWLGLVSRER